MYCIDEQYQLITIQGAEDTLIHIIPSKTLMKHLLKQKDKPKSIKTEVHCINQLMMLPNGFYHHMTSNLINKWIKKQHTPKADYNEEKRQDMTIKETGQKTCLCAWHKNILGSYYK